MIEYKPFEMHTHTVHSDGQFTLDELIAAAKALDFAGIAMTDHNTSSALDAYGPVSVIHDLAVIKGIEWTTFFGHMVVTLAEKFVDWRFATPDTIDDYTAQIKACGGIVGVAHPFELGSPLCTGCFWDFKIRNWENVDYIEIWSKGNPTTHFDNPLSFNWWTDLLNQGNRIAIAAGCDWHCVDDTQLNAATYLGLKDGVISAENIREVFKAGRTFVTCGPVISFNIEQDGQTFSLGDTVSAGPAKLRFSVDTAPRRKIWKRFGIIPREMRIVMNGEPLVSAPCSGSTESAAEVCLNPGWARMEVYGDALSDEGKQIACSSPIYIRE